MRLLLLPLMLLAACGTTDEETERPYVEPDTEGSFDFIRESELLHDKQRGRDVEVSYRIPFKPCPDMDCLLNRPETVGGPFPVIVFSHGFGGSPDSYDFIADHLASHGFFVALPSHPRSNSDHVLHYINALVKVFEEEGLAEVVAQLDGIFGEIISGEEFFDRPRDVSLVIDRVQELALQDRFLGIIDEDRIGVSGHSFGGYTTAASAGAPIDPQYISGQCPVETLLEKISRSDQPDFNPSKVLFQCEIPNGLSAAEGRQSLGDPRILAAVAMAPADSIAFGPDGMEEIAMPFMIMGSTDDALTRYEPEQAEAFEQLLGPDKFLLTLEGGVHGSYNDPDAELDVGEAIEGDVDPAIITGLLGAVTGGSSEPPRQAIERGNGLAKSFAAAFFHRYLRDDERYDHWLVPAAAQVLGDDVRLERKHP